MIIPASDPRAEQLPSFSKMFFKGNFQHNKHFCLRMQQAGETARV
jgi:hypothetical protein